MFAKPQLHNTPGKNMPLFASTLLVAGFLLAVLLRTTIGGVGVSHSPLAGLVFAVMLLAFCCSDWRTLRIANIRRAILFGLAGAVVLCLPAFIHTVIPIAHPAGDYLAWGLVVTIVALAEEAFLRGVLFDAITTWRGGVAAVIITAILFTILHIPLYGWHIIPLDLAVGMWFGVLRITGRSWLAPGIAHALADLASWWMV